LYSCNAKRGEMATKSTIDTDTLFERKIPILTFDDEILRSELDSLVAKEINCFYYKKDTTCFAIWRFPFFGTDNIVIHISSHNSYDIDFSNENNIDQDQPMEWRREEKIYGYFKHKGFSFFCYASCMKYTELFYETGDSIKVKNSPLLYVKEESIMIDDSRTYWSYIYKDKSLIVSGKTTCIAVHKTP